MFQYRVLKKIFGPNMDDVTEGQRKLNRKKPLPSLIIIRLIQSREMIWEGHLTYTGKMNAFMVLVAKP